MTIHPKITRHLRKVSNMKEKETLKSNLKETVSRQGERGKDIFIFFIFREKKRSHFIHEIRTANSTKGIIREQERPLKFNILQYKLKMKC